MSTSTYIRGVINRIFIGKYASYKNDSKLIVGDGDTQKTIRTGIEKGGGGSGLTILRHKNGMMKEKGYYKNVERDGLWTFGYENGKRKEEGNYKDGEEDGLSTHWYQNGQKRYEETWKGGKLASQEKKFIEYRNELKVDRTDAKSTAGAILRAYKAKDLRTLATLSTKGQYDFFIENCNSTK